MCVHLTLSLSEMYLLRTQCVVDRYIPHVCMYICNRRFVLGAAAAGELKAHACNPICGCTKACVYMNSETVIQ